VQGVEIRPASRGAGRSRRLDFVHGPVRGRIPWSRPRRSAVPPGGSRELRLAARSSAGVAARG